MATQFQSVAEAAAELTGDVGMKEAVEHAVNRSQVVSTLIQIRIQKGIKQSQIAERMNCTPSKISRLESGDDLQLKWSDIIGYLGAVNFNLSIMLEDQDESIEASARIKHLVCAIHEQLETLGRLAEEVNDDATITEKIHQFYGEVLFNFMLRFEDSYDKLTRTLKVSRGEVGVIQESSQSGAEQHAKPLAAVQ